MAEKGATLRKWAKKLAVESEPGLTNAQLMVCVRCVSDYPSGRRKEGKRIREKKQTHNKELLVKRQKQIPCGQNHPNTLSPAVN